MLETVTMQITLSVLSILLAIVAMVTIVEAQCDESSFIYDMEKETGDYQYSDEVLPVCNSLYLEVEKDLLKPNNLFKLRKHFFPDNSVEPNVFRIFYFINFSNVSSELCPGTSDGNQTADLIIDEGSPIYSTTIDWTSSVTYATISPKITSIMEPSILFLFEYLVLGSTFKMLNLSFNIANFQCAPSDSQVHDALKSITIKLKSYAYKQGPLEGLDKTYRGYTVAESAARTALLVYLLPAISFACIVYITLAAAMRTGLHILDILLPKYVIKWFKKMEGGSRDIKRGNVDGARDIERHVLTEETCAENGDGDIEDDWVVEKDFIEKYFFEIITIIFILNLFNLIVEVVRTGVFPQVEHVYTFKEFAIRQSMLGLYTLFLPIFILCLLLLLLENDDDQENCCCYKICDFFFSSLLVGFFFSFFFYIIVSIIPILILLFVNPIRTIILCSLTITSILLATIYLITMVRNYQRHSDMSCSQKCCLVLSATLITLFGLSVLVIGLLAYISVIQKGVNTGGLLGIFLALIPTAITAAVAWVGKKILTKKNDTTKMNTPTNSVSLTNLNLNIETHQTITTETELNTTPQTTPRQTTSGQTTSGQTTPRHATHGQTTHGQATPGQTTSGQTTPGTSLGQTTPRHATHEQTTHGQATPEQAESSGWCCIL